MFQIRDAPARMAYVAVHMSIHVNSNLSSHSENNFMIERLDILCLHLYYIGNRYIDYLHKECEAYGY